MTVTDRAVATTELAGPPLAVLRTGWLALVGLSLIAGGLSFVEFFDGERGLITGQGPLALQPDLATQLETTLFDVGLLETAQIAIHLTGWALFGGTGVVLFFRKSRDWVAGISSAMLVIVGTSLFAPTGALVEAQPGWESPVTVLGVFEAGPEFWRSLAGVSIILFALTFPDGRIFPRSGAMVAGAVIAHVLLWALFPGLEVFSVTSWPSALGFIWTGGLAVLVVATQIYRYGWASDKNQRRQIRLVVLSLGAVIASFLLIWVLDPDLSQSVDFGLVLVTERLQAIYDLNLLVLLTVALLLFPVSIVVSASRYRLWDMDIVVNRALVYGLLTGLIAGVVFAGVTILGAIVGDRLGTGLGIGVAAALAALVFQPLRSRIQSLVFDVYSIR